MNSDDLQLLLNQLPSPSLIVSENQATGRIQDKRKPLLVISNTDPSWLPGEHWVAFYFPVKDVPEFFDSFGHGPDYYSTDFVSFLVNNSFKADYAYNQRQIQHPKSNICGLYCVLFALSKVNKMPYETFIKQFDPLHLDQNDLKCINLIESTFNVKVK
jgi:hypothetical protein